MREVLKELSAILMMTSMAVEADDLCAPDLFFYGQQFKRKPPEDITAKFETGLLYSIDLWNWTKNSTNSQGPLHNLCCISYASSVTHFLRKTGRKTDSERLLYSMPTCRYDTVFTTYVLWNVKRANRICNKFDFTKQCLSISIAG